MGEALLFQKLERQLQELVELFPGVAGLCVKDLKTGYQIAINGDEEFPTASTIKAQILTQMFRRAEAGELDLSQKVKLSKDVLVPGSGVITYFDDVEELTIRDIAVLMMIVSDNTATNLCIDWATYEGTNGMLRELGIAKTTLRRKMQDHASVAAGNENLATPTEFVQFYEILHRGEQLSKYVCEETLKVLRKPKRNWIQPGLPQDVPIAGKPGGMDRIKTDAAIVYLQHRPYAISVMTKYGPVDRVVPEQWMVDVSRTVYETMEILNATGPFGQGFPANFKR